MSDLQTTSASTPANTEPRRDPTLLARRLLAWAISLGLGVGVTAIVITTVLKTDLLATIPISNWEIPLIIVAPIPLTFLFFIWVDYFLGTKVLPD